MIIDYINTGPRHHDDIPETEFIARKQLDDYPHGSYLCYYLDAYSTGLVLIAVADETMDWYSNYTRNNRGV